MNKIIRNKDNGYSVINNHCLRNKNITEKAKGVFAIIMSLPDNWDFSINGLITICNGGESAIRSAIKELIENGYCQRSVIKHPITKRIIDWEYTFSEKPLCDFPQVEEPQMGNPHLENHTQLNKDELILNLNKDKEYTPKQTSDIVLSEIEKSKDQKMIGFDSSEMSEDFQRYYSVALGFLKQVISTVKESGGTVKSLEESKVGTWVKPIRDLYVIDKVDSSSVKLVYNNLPKDEFWSKTILSTSKLRKQFNTLIIQYASKSKSSYNNSKSIFG
jgi:hypothetical protein